MSVEAYKPRLNCRQQGFLHVVAYRDKERRDHPAIAFFNEREAEAAATQLNAQIPYVHWYTQLLPVLTFRQRETLR